MSAEYQVRGDVAVITQRRLTIRGGDPRPVVDAGGHHAEGKGIWVVRGGEVTIENIEFRGARGVYQHVDFADSTAEHALIATARFACAILAVSALDGRRRRGPSRGRPSRHAGGMRSSCPG